VVNASFGQIGVQALIKLLILVTTEPLMTSLMTFYLTDFYAIFKKGLQPQRHVKIRP
jgi:hypothetical protein